MRSSLMIRGYVAAGILLTTVIAADPSAASMSGAVGWRGSSGAAKQDAEQRGGPSDPQDEFSGIRGTSASSAVREVKLRGFHQVDSFRSSGNARGTIWWNRHSGECLRIIIAKRRISSIADIGTHPRCA